MQLVQIQRTLDASKLLSLRVTSSLSSKDVEAFRFFLKISTTCSDLDGCGCSASRSLLRRSSFATSPGLVLGTLGSLPVRCPTAGSAASAPAPPHPPSAAACRRFRRGRLTRRPPVPQAPRAVQSRAVARVPGSCWHCQRERKGAHALFGSALFGSALRESLPRSALPLVFPEGR